MFRRSSNSRLTPGEGVPDDPGALNALGVMLVNQGRLDEAEFLLRRAAAAGDANALNNLGNLLEIRGDKPGAAMYWRQAAERGRPRAMCSLAMYLVTSQELAEADIWYRKAKDRAGSDPHLYGMLQLIGVLLENQRAASAGQDQRGEGPDDQGLSEDRDRGVLRAGHIRAGPLTLSQCATCATLRHLRQVVLPGNGGNIRCPEGRTWLTLAQAHRVRG